MAEHFSEENLYYQLKLDSRAQSMNAVECPAEFLLMAVVEAAKYRSHFSLGHLSLEVDIIKNYVFLLHPAISACYYVASL